MKIFIESNFVVPGLEEEESLELEGSQVTLGEFLEKLSMMSPDGLSYVEPGADRLDPDDWEIEINHVPYQSQGKGLESPLRDGDVVTIRVLAQGGG